MPAATGEALERLDPEEVVVLGGASVVASQVGADGGGSDAVSRSTSVIGERSNAANTLRHGESTASSSAR